MTEVKPNLAIMLKSQHKRAKQILKKLEQEQRFQGYLARLQVSEELKHDKM